jgi:hypothetical protein
MKTLAFHLQIVPTPLARFRLNLSAKKKASKQYYENRQSNNRRDSDNITLRPKRKSIHQHSSARSSGWGLWVASVTSATPVPMAPAPILIEDVDAVFGSNLAHVRRRSRMLALLRRRTGIAVELVRDDAEGKFVGAQVRVVASGEVLAHLHHREHAAHFERPEAEAVWFESPRLCQLKAFQSPPASWAGLHRVSEV